jgi:hypothetical protein
MKSCNFKLRIIVCVLLPLTILMTATPALARTTYSPDAIREALLNEPMLASEKLLGGVTGRTEAPPDPHFSATLYGVVIASMYGGVGFHIYATDEEALSEAHLDVLDPIQDDEDPSITYYILWGTGDANTNAGAIVVVGNVMVMGIATPQDTYNAGLIGSVGGAAGLASNHAKHGVDFLRRIGAGASAPTATATVQQMQQTPAALPMPTATRVIMPPTATRVIPPPTATRVILRPTPTVPTTTVLVPVDEPTAVKADQVNTALPEMVIPANLQVQSGPSYRLERAEAIELTPSDTTTPRAVGTYTASQVAWILDHPDFMNGTPYREIQSLLAAPDSPFFAHFTEPAAVVDSLRQFGWEDGYLRVHVLDVPQAGAAGWVEASAHRFATLEGAQRAARYLADQFAISSGFALESLATTADQTFAYSGPGYNGNETAVFAQRGNFVFAVIGVASSGSPDATIQAVADSAVSALADLEQPSASQAQDVTALFPPGAEMSSLSPGEGPWYRFEIVEEGSQSAADVAAWLGGDDAAAQLSTWGWQDNTYRVYHMHTPDRPTDVTISIHEFADRPVIAGSDGSVLSGQLIALDAFAE